MNFDDRLATVLRQRADGGRAARTQYRQLLDLLGHRKPVRGRELAARGWQRINALAEAIPVADRARIVGEPGWRLTSPELVAHLANDEAAVAAAALAHAKLSAQDWEVLIPRLPVRARGFLRFRDDLPRPTQALLDRLGVHDRGLPQPERPVSEPAAEAAPVQAPAPSPLPEAANEEESEIGQLVKRIEEFQRARSDDPSVTPDPRLPLGDAREGGAAQMRGAFDFTTDATGAINWASEAVAPMVVGAQLRDAEGTVLARMAERRPLTGEEAQLDGAPAIAGAWEVHAAPIFDHASGSYTGHAGRMRRAPSSAGNAAAARAAAQADTIRQMLHELRTPVNAIQGFSELIQQQMFGPVPHEYRAHAATIAGDAARMLAGFDELDRLARLESGAMEMEPGTSDFAAIVRAQVDQLQGVLAARMAGFDSDIPDDACPVSVARDEATGIAWRLLATLAATASPGEEIELSLTCAPDAMCLHVHLTATLMGQDDIYCSTAKAGGNALSSGAFGSGFALRLARAEARATGGDMRVEEEDWLLLVLPNLTGAQGEPSAGGPSDGARGQG